MKKQRRDVDTFSLSFLDCICCGFGAIILLLVLTKIYEPIRLEESHEDLQRVIQRLQEELYEIRGETQFVNRELNTVEEQVSDEKLRLARSHQSTTAGWRLMTRQRSDCPQAALSAPASGSRSPRWQSDRAQSPARG